MSGQREATEGGQRNWQLEAETWQDLFRQAEDKAAAFLRSGQRLSARIEAALDLCDEADATEVRGSLTKTAPWWGSHVTTHAVRAALLGES